MLRWALLFFGLAAAAPSAAPAAEPARLALVIGNSAYAGLAPIPACAASSGVVSAALRRAGFTVTEVLNPSNARMGEALSDFGDALAKAPGSAALVYACGYAVGFEGRPFLLPASARLLRETDALTEGLVGRVMTGALAGADLRAGLLVLDTVTRPGGAPVPLPALGFPAPLATKGMVAANSATVPPDGPTPLASAVAASLTGRSVDAKAMLADLTTTLQTAPGLQVLVQAPTEQAWLIGGPALAAAPATPPPPPPPEPVPAPPPLPPPAPSPVPEPAPPAIPAPAAEAPQPAAPGTPGQPDGAATFNQADRRRVQLALQRLGYYDGRVDGVFGPESLAAIRRFQHELGAEMTGRLTVDQAARLFAVK